MKSFKDHISSQDIFTFLVSIMALGFGVQYVSSFIEVTQQTLFMDTTLSVLVLFGFGKFISERV